MMQLPRIVRRWCVNVPSNKPPLKVTLTRYLWFEQLLPRLVTVTLPPMTAPPSVIPFTPTTENLPPVTATVDPLESGWWTICVRHTAGRSPRATPTNVPRTELTGMISVPVNESEYEDEADAVAARGKETTKAAATPTSLTRAS